MCTRYDHSRLLWSALAAWTMTLGAASALWADDAMDEFLVRARQSRQEHRAATDEFIRGLDLTNAQARQLLTLIDEGFSRVSVNEEAFQEHNARLDEEASGLAFITDKGSVEKNYYVDGAGRLLVNTPFETRDLYPMMARPDRDEVEFC